MKRFSLLIFTLLVLNGQVVAADSGMSDVQKVRFCERIRDHALQTYYNRERGQPIKLFAEDGSDGARITNTIIKRIYADLQISTPKKAEDFGRAKCNEMMGTKQVPE
ncbi:MAG: hypothetical protein RLZZ298_172 [Pseudomonadota bacterium]|jgi:hypothetical protein